MDPSAQATIGHRLDPATQSGPPAAEFPLPPRCHPGAAVLAWPPPCSARRAHVVTGEGRAGAAPEDSDALLKEISPRAKQKLVNEFQTFVLRSAMAQANPGFLPRTQTAGGWPTHTQLRALLPVRPPPKPGAVKR